MVIVEHIVFAIGKCDPLSIIEKYSLGVTCQKNVFSLANALGMHGSGVV
jgi:hypothetical protein